MISGPTERSDYKSTKFRDPRALTEAFDKYLWQKNRALKNREMMGFD